jgi:hypothetical protein
MQRLPAREAATEGVPPSEAILTSLPAEVDDLVPDSGGEVDESSMDVLHFAAEGEHRIDVRLDGSIEVRLLLEKRRIGFPLLRRRAGEALAIIGLGVFHELSEFPRPGQFGVEAVEDFLELREEHVRLGLREQA